MERTSVNSSNIKSIGYDPRELRMQVEFRSGRLYSFYNVPPKAHQEFMQAESKGKHFASHIANSFPFTRGI